MTDKELHILIERYFEAETSIAEERMLRNALAARNIPAGTDSLIDEARAVMSISAAIGNNPQATSAGDQHKRSALPAPSVWWRSVAAAAIAAILITGLTHIGNLSTDSECVAYLNGREISDRDAVMSLMFSELSEMEAASASVQNEISDDFSEIASAFNEFE